MGIIGNRGVVSSIAAALAGMGGPTTWPTPVRANTPAAPKHGRPATRGRRHRSQRSRANRRKAARKAW